MALMTVAEAREIIGKSGLSTGRIQILLDNSEAEITSVAGYPHSGNHVYSKFSYAAIRHLHLPPSILTVIQVRERQSDSWDVLDTDRYLLVGRMLQKRFGYWRGWTEVTGTLSDETVKRKQVQAQLLALDVMDYTAAAEEVGSYQADYRDRLTERKKILQNLQVHKQWV